MPIKKMSIDDSFDAALRAGLPQKEIAKKPRAVPPSRRVKLPLGLSYHPTPQGVKFRIRIRSQKKLAALGFAKPVDEIFDELGPAEARLLELKYGKDRVREANNKKAIDESVALLKTVTLEALCNEHYNRYYSKLKGAKEHKSRMRVICETEVPTSDSRLSILAHIRYDHIKIDSARIPFGMIPVVEYENYLNAYIDIRKLKVKNQTVVNDLMFLHTALKSCHNYFRNIPQIVNPLRTVNFKTLRDQVTYVDKRLRPETRVKIEQLLIQYSREPHYANFFIFLSETGCRLSEALSVCKKDIDLQKSIIFLVSKKNEKPRYLPITEKLRPVVLAHIDGKGPTERLFPHSKHTYQTKLKNMKSHLADAGISFSWHMLRHTFISNNIDSKNVFQLMSELDITNFQHFQQRYLEQEEAEKIAIKLAQAGILTPQETRRVVGHGSMEVTGAYMHHQIPQSSDLLKKENEELRARIASLLARQSTEN